MTEADWQAFRVTMALAAVTTLVLVVVGTPIAWWLARARRRLLTDAIEAVVALPLVLPPTVLGFYMLVLLGPRGAVGQFFESIGLTHLAFTFPGLVIASAIHSLPFMVQPLREAFHAVGDRMLEAAATLRAGPWDRFVHVVLPLSRRGILTALALTFAHTVGEFGVVLMVGGNIPGSTRVLSIAIYDHAESMDYAAAGTLSAILLVGAFALLVFVYSVNRRTVKAHP